jgi:hypothetical protein
MNLHLRWSRVSVIRVEIQKHNARLRVRTAIKSISFSNAINACLDDIVFCCRCGLQRHMLGARIRVKFQKIGRLVTVFGTSCGDSNVKLVHHVEVDNQPTVDKEFRGWAMYGVRFIGKK